MSDLEFGRGAGSLCANDTDCDMGNYCDLVLGRCTPQKHAGDECGEARQCDTDQCADGICCDTACEGPCRSCAVAGSEGQCVEHAAGTDPDDECRGTTTCGGAGQCTGQHLWSYSFGDENGQEGLAVAVDSEGNVIVAGDFYGELSLGADPFTADSGTDIYVAKFTPEGEHVWSQRFGGYSYQHLSAMAVDASDRIVLAGHFEGTIDFGPPLTSASYADVYVAKLSPSGQVLWASRFGGLGDQTVTGLAVDTDENIAVSGANHGSMVIGPNQHDNVGTSYGDIWLAKLDPSGGVLWSAAYGNGSDQAPAGLAFDGSGNLYMVGFTRGVISLGGDQLDDYGEADVFLAKYNGDGGHVWSMRFGDGSSQYAADVAVDSEGSVLLTGRFSGSLNFGGNQLSSTNLEDIYLAKLRPDGSHEWSRRFGDEFDQESEAVAIDADDNVLLTGMFTLGVDLGGGPHTCAGQYDAFLVKVTPAGEHTWSQTFGSLLAERGNDVVADAEGNILLVGTYEHQIDLGGGPFAAEGATDIFLAKLAP